MPDQLDDLTEKEYETAVMIHNGLSARQISVKEGVCLGTVRNRLYGIYDKLGIRGESHPRVRLAVMVAEKRKREED